MILLDTSIEVKENKGDVIGVGIDGNGNIIWKNVSIVIREFSQDCGLTLIPPNYFKENENVSEDFNQWLKGFPSSLPSIYQKKDYRRKTIICEIKKKLKDKKRILLLGESGTSKSTLFMDLMCDYFDGGCKILYNLGDDELKNVNIIYSRIKGLVDADNNVLVVVDNVHNQKMALIFNVIKQFQTLNLKKKQKISFLLAARIPEFDWLLEKPIFDDVNIIPIIESLFIDGENQYRIPYFSINEIRVHRKI